MSDASQWSTGKSNDSLVSVHTHIYMLKFRWISIRLRRKEQSQRKKLRRCFGRLFKDISLLFLPISAGNFFSSFAAIMPQIAAEGDHVSGGIGIWKSVRFVRAYDEREEMRWQNARERCKSLQKTKMNVWLPRVSAGNRKLVCVSTHFMPLVCPQVYRKDNCILFMFINF